MKDMSTVLLAALFVLISLVSLISAGLAPAGPGSSQAHMAELGIRYALKR